jgi:hypothetical protein
MEMMGMSDQSIGYLIISHILSNELFHKGT